MSDQCVGTDTCSVATETEPDCLGPCEPGTHVNLDGIVWQETENGREKIHNICYLNHCDAFTIFRVILNFITANLNINYLYKNSNSLDLNRFLLFKYNNWDLAQVQEICLPFPIHYRSPNSVSETSCIHNV